MSETEHVESGPPYPTFEQLRELGLRVESSQALRRVHKWYLSPRWQGDIFVTEPDASGQLSSNHFVRHYFNPRTGQLHDIAQVPISEPKISAVTVSVGNFNRLEAKFDDIHADCFAHYDDDDNEQECIAFLLQSDRERIELPEGYDPDDPNRPTIHDFKKLKCCYQARPTSYIRSIEVRCRSSGPGYVTVHDYITTVHPWLCQLQSEILEADKIHDTEGVIYQTPIFENMRVGAYSVNEVFVGRSRPRPTTNIILSAAGPVETGEIER